MHSDKAYIWSDFDVIIEWWNNLRKNTCIISSITLCYIIIELAVAGGDS